jgi:heme a synthase
MKTLEPARRLMWFRRLALAGALLAACVVILGAWVRLTDAGLGCPDWPGCYGKIYPDQSHDFAKALHEMVHRYFATTLGLIIIALFAFALLNRRIRGQPLLAVGVLLLIVCLQGALGALTVTLLLKPFIVTSHLLGGLTTLGVLWWLALPPETRVLAPQERALRLGALAGFLALVLQIALGGWTSTNYAAAACPDLPTCQGAWWPAQMDFKDAFVLSHGLDINYTGGVLANGARVAIQVTHRCGAAVVGGLLLLLAAFCMVRATSRRLRVAGLMVGVAVLVQIGIGLSMVYEHLPLPLATLHNAGAALLVLCMVTLLRMLWPVAPNRHGRL